MSTAGDPVSHWSSEARAEIAFLTPPSGAPIRRRFEFVSRGDFVPGHLARPNADGDVPLLLVLADGRSAIEVEPLASKVVGSGKVAVATLDLPLHGARQSPKLSDRLTEGLRRLARGTALDGDTRALVEEFATQTMFDATRAIQGLSDLDGLDGDRVAVLGLGVGACAAAWALPRLTDLRACVLAGDVGEFTDAGLDPKHRIATAGSALDGVTCRLYTVAGSEVSRASADTLAKALPGEGSPLDATDDSSAEEIATFLIDALDD